MYGGAICLRWFKDTFGNLEDLASTISEINVYEIYDRLAHKSSIGANGLFFMPYIRGSGAPYNDPGAKGAFIGFDARSKKEDFVRAIFESVGYSLKQLLVLIETHDVSVEDVAMIGGGAKSVVWRRLIADILNKKIHRVQNAQEANARGAAILGAIGTKLYENENELSREWFKEREVDIPDAEQNKEYERRFEIFNGFYDLLRPAYRQIEDLQKNAEQL
jgi:xylulokinase